MQIMRLTPLLTASQHQALHPITQGADDSLGVLQKSLKFRRCKLRDCVTVLHPSHVVPGYRTSQAT